MTKLTKEQIEQERVKFEEAFKKIAKDKLEEESAKELLKYIWSGDICCHLNSNIYFIFQMWLARAELDKGE